MSVHSHDFSLFDSSFPDLYIDAIEQKNLGTQSESVASTSRTEGMIGTMKRRTSPPRHRHDGTSPLPLGMDWSIPPTLWDGRDSIWPHDPHTGWSYCVTIPSWTMLPRSSGSGAVVFYGVQVGVQSPEGITTITGTLRRFSDFLKLFSEVKKLFPWKKLPSAPPRRLLMRTKSRTLVDERRCLLEDWMEKLLSDIDVSRSAPVANFLELEVAARSCFNDFSMSDATSTVQERPSSDMSLFAGASSAASDYGEDSVYEISEIGTPKHGEYSVSELSRENSFSELGFNGSAEAILSRSNSFPMRNFMQAIRSFSRDKMLSRGADRTANNDKFNQGTSRLASYGENGRESLSEEENNKGRAAHNRKLSSDSGGSAASSARFSEISNLGTTSAFADIGFNFPERSDASSHTKDLNPPVELPSDSGVVLPSELRRKCSTVIVTLQRRLAIAKTDMEDLVSRFQQEIAARQYLVMKVKDLETELEIARETNKESLKNAVSSERERYTQMQWDMEELRKRCLELELRLKDEQDEKGRIESAKLSVIQENEMLLQELDDAREQLDNMQKHHEESEMKSKTDVKLLVKEVRSLRRSQTELKQELSRLMKEKLEAEKILEREKQRRELISTMNAKLLYECDILRNRLQECSVSFNVEEEDRLVMDTSSLSDAVDLLTTSDNRIGLLLAEAQLLAQDVETLSSAAAADTKHGGVKVTDNEMRKMLTDAFVDNATLRKQINSLIRCALRTSDAYKFERDEDDPDPH